VTETRSFVIFRSPENEVLAWVPKRSFATPDELGALRQFIAGKVPGPSNGFPVVPQ
jgi:hypothetical protein